MYSAILVLAAALFPLTAGAQQSSERSEGVFSNRVEACSDAKNRAVRWAKANRTPLEFVLKVDPSYELSECDCSTISKADQNWVCAVTVRIKAAAVGSAQQQMPPGPRVSDVRNFAGLGEDQLEACIRAKDLAASYVRSVPGGAISSFGACSCDRRITGAKISWTCATDTTYSRPAESNSRGMNF